MALFIILQARYTLYEIGLFDDTRCLEIIAEDKKYASKNLIPNLQALLNKHAIRLTDIAAFGVNRGPAPFTSLRIVVTTANGLACATGIPLIGINGLEALLLEHTDSQWPYTVALLNAFNNDLYYAIQSPTGIQIGCQKSDELFIALKNQFPQTTIRFIGNGTTLYQGTITKLFDSAAFIPEVMPDMVSLEYLAQCTYQRFIAHDHFEKQLLPLYLKELSYIPQL